MISQLKRAVTVARSLTRRGGLRRISPSCRSCCANKNCSDRMQYRGHRLAHGYATTGTRCASRRSNEAAPRQARRRGGRKPGTPNKKTALVTTAFAAATSNPELSPLDFFLAVMRDPSIPPDWRFRAAQVAAPYVHPKPERAQAVDPEATAKQIEGPYKDLSKDPLYEAFQAYARGGAESSPNSKETPKS